MQNIKFNRTIVAEWKLLKFTWLIIHPPTLHHKLGPSSQLQGIEQDPVILMTLEHSCLILILLFTDLQYQPALRLAIYEYDYYIIVNLNKLVQQHNVHTRYMHVCQTPLLYLPDVVVL